MPSYSNPFDAGFYNEPRKALNAKRRSPGNAYPCCAVCKSTIAPIAGKALMPENYFGISASVCPETAPQTIGSSNVLPPAPWLAATVNVLLIQAACIAGPASAMRLRQAAVAHCTALTISASNIVASPLHATNAICASPAGSQVICNIG